MDKKLQDTLPSNNQASSPSEPQQNWKTSVCSRCGSAVYYLENWIVKPKLCQRFRLRDFGNLRSILERYLQFEDEIWLKPMPPRERQIAARKRPLLEKVRSAINDNPTNNALMDACLKDRDLSKLAFRLGKEKFLKSKPGNDSRTLPRSFRGFVQGGAPGLGKKS